MNTERITGFIRWLYKIRPKSIPKHTIRNLTLTSESIDTEIGLYQVIQLSTTGLWFMLMIFPMGVCLYSLVWGGYIPPPPHPTLIHMILSLLSLWAVIGIGGYISFYLPFQPYFIIKFSKKKGKELANLLQTYSAYNFIIMVAILLLMPISMVLSASLMKNMLYGKYSDEVGLFLFGLGFLTLIFIVYLPGTLLSFVLYVYNSMKKKRGKPTWFDELKARIEMREEKAGVKNA